MGAGDHAGSGFGSTQAGQQSDKVGVWYIWDVAPQPEVKLTALTSIEKPERNFGPAA